eukprot:SAG25_NODE_1493_length_2905_cov_3.886671_1_plen_53_part_00
MEYMSSQKDQNGIFHPRMTLNGILKLEGPNRNISLNMEYLGSKDQNGISPYK